MEGKNYFSNNSFVIKSEAEGGSEIPKGLDALLVVLARNAFHPAKSSKILPHPRSYLFNKRISLCSIGDNSCTLHGQEISAQLWERVIMEDLRKSSLS